MIRAASKSDKRAVVELMKAFFLAKGFDKPDNPYGFTIEPDEAFAEHNFNSRVENPNACIFVYDVEGVARGAVIGDVADHPWGRARYACDFMFWIDPEHRGGVAAVRLAQSYLGWAREQGAVPFMKHFEGDDAVGAFYARLGGRPIERTYIFAN